MAARKVAYRFVDQFGLSELRELLASNIAEHRFIALEMLVRKYERGSVAEQIRIAQLYLRNLKHVDHWVLVDTSASYILGQYLLKRRRTILFELAASPDAMKRRAAMVATAAFIRQNDFADTLRIAEMLLADPDPLIHRAVGWMVREIGKRSSVTARRFLDQHHHVMPRLMLRYAVELLPLAQRKKYLALRRRKLTGR